MYKKQCKVLKSLPEQNVKKALTDSGVKKRILHFCIKFRQFSEEFVTYSYMSACI